MTQKEFESWINFYSMHPFDDFHRFHRPAALISRSFSGADIADLLEWLQPQPKDETYSDADLNTFKALGIKRPPRSK